ncbi:MAG: sugar phosphate isomerase/epimerase [Bryobacterales bacterium]|nr:sugar phosphate isomerase/epimerase [Bryobacterales bacterium]
MARVDRRTFLQSAAVAPAASSLAAAGRLPLGLNTYCLRALRWNDAQLLEYAAGLKLDCIFLQDSLDPKAMEPSHWAEVRAQAGSFGLSLATGGGGVLPKTPEAFESSRQHLILHARRAAAMGSPIVRCVCAAERSAFPPGAPEQHMETMIRLLKSVRPEITSSGVKVAIEIHKDWQAWELKRIIEGAGKDFVGVYLDTGNPVFVMEDPLLTLETLAPYALTLHLRDSVVYEHKRGIAVQWVPLGEGVIDFKRIAARARELCPGIPTHVKPITGRPPTILPIYEDSFWKMYPHARASELSRFLAIARQGHPYENHMVIEDLPGRQTPAQFVAAIQFQQRDHMERGIEYAKKTLDLGNRWRA